MIEKSANKNNINKSEFIRKSIKNECDRLDNPKTTKIVQPSRRDMMGSRNLRRRNPDRIEEYEDGNCNTKAMLLNNLPKRYR